MKENIIFILLLMTVFTVNGQKKLKEADGDWDKLMLLMKDGGYPPKEEWDKAKKENGWVGYTLAMEKQMRNILNCSAVFCDKYPTDERTIDAFIFFTRAHVYSMASFIDTNKVNPELSTKINALYNKVTEYYNECAPQGKKIATGPPLFRLYPRDLNAQANWRTKREKLFNQVISLPYNSPADKEIIEWSMFVSDWGQASQGWNPMPDMAETPESQVEREQSDYWELAATHFWEGMWFRFEQYIKKNAELPILADRALDFLGGTGGLRHTETTVKRYWQRIRNIYGDPKHPLHQKTGIQALIKQAEMQVGADEVAAGKKPVEFKFTALDGREVDLMKLRGKVVLLDFWATWCKPCLASMPHLKRIYDEYHDQGLEIIGICLDPGLWDGKIEEGNRLEVEAAIKKYNISWPQRFTGRHMSDPIAKSFNISALPTLWLLDKRGIVRDKITGTADLEMLIRKHLELDK